MSEAAKYLKQEIIINQLSEKEAKWFAVYTKYKCEKYVAQQLKKKNIEVYIPLASKTKRYLRKIKNYQVPLIPCYVFVKIKKAHYLPTIETEHVIKFLKQGKDLLAIPDKEIEVLHRVSGEIIEAFQSANHPLQQGEEVEVTSGLLTGMKGKIVDKTGKKSFLVELETLGLTLRIDIDRHILNPIKKHQLIT